MTALAPQLSLAGLSKSFDGAHALQDVSIEIRPGTVHALIGENGAGKSTLGKIVAGIHSADAGTISADGEIVHFSSPRDALRHGITMVAQEIALVGTRSVIENVYLGSELHRGPFVRTRELRRAYERLIDEVGIRLPATALVDDLTVADQQKVEILRAIARQAKVIVMDEPTARLATHEALALRSIVKRLRDRGTTIIYVSHFLEEVLDVSDEITILRDGRRVTTGPAHGQTATGLVEQMIGRSLDSTFPPKSPPPVEAAVRLRVSGLASHAFAGVDLEVRRGEIVAITGMVGSGRSEVLRAIYGSDRSHAGTVELDGVPRDRRTPGRSIRAGVSFVSESRKTDGLILDFAVRDNVSLPSLARFTRAGLVRRKAEAAAVAETTSAVGVKLQGILDTVGTLSGGNQQKVMFAKALLGEPVLLLVDEPTRGVDVGAKRQIYGLLTELARRGLGVLLVSSEMEEVIGLAHRVVVMRRGRLAGTLAHDELTEQGIAALAFGEASTLTDEEVHP
ncbi:sugar ABC transporter ATP-binding protein [Agromyces aerolatus]|uniref:sugar ABC transporter ATP-binding protein n=1 Tax=Agromyces sp. LY-1074 TaxID=3074080 RepID=UPI002864CAE8|nr:MULTISPECIES: sugar ABC transporter ATP-binding protein [unclassified Agromyces]MDR5699328.1 sugar ABC transporter ATP-binding protein [Agromyces sp. LY-1074]MDR5705624.1 sugar ABC transporter ATP-binding protein [Agromyces sp. LY-1358]